MVQTTRAAFEIETLPGPARMTRARLVECIVELNPSASPGFLEQFPQDRLRLYFERLTMAREPRGGATPWVRAGDSPAIVCRERVD